MNNIIPVKTFDTTKLSFGKISTNTSGKAIQLLYDDQSFTIKFPKMMIPFSPNDFKDNKKFKMSINFDDKPESADFQQFCIQMDNWLVDKMSTPTNTSTYLGLSKSKTWSKDVILSKYNSIIHQPRDKTTGEINTNFGPSFRVCFPSFSQGSFSTGFFDHESQEIDINMANIKDQIPKGTIVTGLVDFRIYASSTNGFGYSISAKQIKIVEHSTTNKFASCMLDDPTDE